MAPLGDFHQAKSSQKPFFDGGGQGCRIISVNQFPALSNKVIFTGPKCGHQEMCHSGAVSLFSSKLDVITHEIRACLNCGYIDLSTLLTIVKLLFYPSRKTENHMGHMEDAMRHIILATMLILVVLSLSLPVGATNATFIKSKSDDSSVLILGDGSVWEVVANHRSESKEWSLGDRIIVPDSKDCLFNVSHGEAVDAQLLQTKPQQEYRR